MLTNCFNQQYLYPGPHDPILDFLAFVLLVVILYLSYTRRFIKYEPLPRLDNNDFIVERDVLGMEKVVPTNVESFAPRRKSFNWQLILLFILLIVGIYFVAIRQSKVVEDLPKNRYHTYIRAGN